MERPKVGLAVIIKRENKILLGKRIGAHAEGTWCFPGGHLEFFESLEDCAKRETKEETGLEINNIKFLTITNDLFKDENKHYITIYMIAETEGEVVIKEPEKCVEWKWCDISNLPEPLFLPIINLLKQNPDILK